MPVSSKQVIHGLERQGFKESKGTGNSGTHRTYYRRRDGETSQTVTVVLAQREIPQGTLRNYARQLGLRLADLMAWVEAK